MKHSILAAAVGTLVWVAAPVAAQTAPAAEAKTPRTADGHPDLSGVWWRGADVGGRTASGANPIAAPARGATPPPTFPGLYNAAAKAHAKTLSDKDDPSLGCVSTAFGTLGVSLFDVGAVAQIVQTPKFVILLTETYHGFQIVPTDGRPHRDSVPPSYRGDAIGRWDGDTLIVDKTNFVDNNWMSAEGRVSFHSDALHTVERYHRVGNTLEIEATLYDPKVLTEPFVAPKQTLVLAPFDQIMELSCSPGDTPELIDAAAKIKK